MTPEDLRGTLFHAMLVGVIAAAALALFQATEQAPQNPLEKLSFLELLERQPANPWVRMGGETFLDPVIVEMMRRARSGKMTDDEWLSALTASGLIHTRSRWLSGAALEIGINHPEWLRLSRITVRAVEPNLGEVRFDDTNPSHCGNCQDSRKQKAQHLKLGEFPEGTTHVIFEVEIEQRDDPEAIWSRSKVTSLLWKGRLERPILAVATAAEVIPATQDAALGELVRKRLGAYRSARAFQYDVRFGLHGAYEEFPVFRRTGVSLTLDLWHGQELKQSVDLVVQTQSDLFDRVERFAGWASIPELEQQLGDPEAGFPDWELRVRSNPSKVLGIWDADRWWEGSFSMPLAESFEHGKW